MISGLTLFAEGPKKGGGRGKCSQREFGEGDNKRQEGEDWRSRALK